MPKFLVKVQFEMSYAKDARGNVWPIQPPPDGYLFAPAERIFDTNEDPHTVEQWIGGRLLECRGANGQG